MSQRNIAPRAALLAALSCSVLVVTACGGGDEVAGGPDETITVTTVDYAFQGLPEVMAAGTTLELTNDSEGELHELVAIKLADDEDRTLDELLALPEEEQQALGEPATVILAPPGEEGFAVVGDGTIDEAGRYVVICAIPQGADPQAFLEGAEGATEAPEVDGGPPHFTLGMVQEVEVR